MRAFYDFLMDDLYTIREVFEDDHDIAEELCVLFSVDGGSIPEIFWRLYIAKVDVDFEKLMNVTSYFTGAGFMHISCDCSEEDSYLCDIPSIPNNPLFLKGREDAEIFCDHYVMLSDKIDSLRSEMLT